MNYEEAKHAIRKADPRRTAGFWWAVVATIVVATMFVVVLLIAPGISHTQREFDRLSDQNNFIVAQNVDLQKQVDDQQAELTCRAQSAVDLDVASGDALADTLAYVLKPLDQRKPEDLPIIVAKVDVLKIVTQARKDTLAKCASESTTPGG